MLSEHNVHIHSYQDMSDALERPNIHDEVPQLGTKRFKKVLVVDDNRDIRLALADLLVNEGYFVSTARDGQDGLLHLFDERELPDLIVLDMKMPVKDGRQFLQEKLKHPEISEIPVVVISGELSPEELRELPVRSSLQKPFNWLEVLETVKVCSQKIN